MNKVARFASKEPPLDVDTMAMLMRLAALHMAPAEAAQMRTELGKVVAFVDAMQTAETAGVAPLAHPLDGIQPLRPDRVTEAVRRELLQRGAPSVRDGFYLVPKVVE